MLETSLVSRWSQNVGQQALKPTPPSPLMYGSTAARAAAAATMASTALPPARSTSMPAAVASGCADATAPCMPATGGRVRVHLVWSFICKYRYLGFEFVKFVHDCGARLYQLLAQGGRAANPTRASARLTLTAPVGRSLPARRTTCCACGMQSSHVGNPVSQGVEDPFEGCFSARAMLWVPWQSVQIFGRAFGASGSLATVGREHS